MLKKPEIQIVIQVFQPALGSLEESISQLVSVIRGSFQRTTESTTYNKEGELVQHTVVRSGPTAGEVLTAIDMVNRLEGRY